MNVLVVTAVHMWNDVRIFHKEIVSLQRNHSIELVAIAPFRFKNIGAIRIIGLTKYKSKFCRIINWMKIFRYIRNSSCEIIHFHDIELLPIFIFLKYTTGKVFIYDCHEHFPKVALSRDWIPLIIKKPLSRLIAYFEPIMANKLDYTIVANSSSEDSFFHDVTTIRNFPIVETGISRNNYNRTGTYEIIYVGDITIDRGIWQMLNSILALSKKRNDFHFSLVGRIASESLYQQVNNFIKINQLSGLITCYGYIDFTKLNQLFNAADIGLCLFNNNLRADVMIPTKAFEYMAYGIPFIVDNLPELKALLGIHKCCLFRDSENPNSCTELLEILMDNTGKYREMSTTGEWLVNNHFNWNTEAARLITLYDTIRTIK